MDSYIFVDDVSNPSLPERLRTTTTFFNDFIPEKYSFKVGIGVRINSLDK